MSLSLGGLDIAVAQRAKAEVSGDAWLAAEEGDQITVALLDGAGSGALARAEAKRARAVLEGRPGVSVEDRLEAAHRELQGGRGCVASLALISPSTQTLAWAGVGNVEMVLIARGGGARTLIPARGMLGVRMADRIRGQTVTWAEGDLLILGTDGVHRAFTVETNIHHLGPVGVAEHLFEAFANSRDDASLLVVGLSLGATPDGSP